ncbi:MAG: YqhA family protein, partial [Chlorobiaceae bacterium]|nr:YqhA family protein [Chlorobiaceae bacterium]
MRNLLSSSRYVVLIAVVSSFIASLTLMAYAGIAIVQQIISVVLSGTVSTREGKLIALDFIQNADI